MKRDKCDKKISSNFQTWWSNIYLLNVKRLLVVLDWINLWENHLNLVLWISISFCKYWFVIQLYIYLPLLFWNWSLCLTYWTIKYCMRILWFWSLVFPLFWLRFLPLSLTFLDMSERSHPLSKRKQLF